MLEERNYRGYTVVVDYDPDPINPRNDDNTATLVCAHCRYNLGDSQDLEGTIRALLDKYACLVDASVYNKCVDGTYGIAKQLAALSATDEIFIAALYGYDHSGFSISADVAPATLSDMRWDGGVLGFAYVERNRFPGDPDWKKAQRYLNGELDVYNAYLNGEVYCYTTTDPDGNEVAFCGGFYGDNGLSALWESAECGIDYEIAARHRQRVMNIDSIMGRYRDLIGLSVVVDDNVYAFTEVNDSFSPVLMTARHVVNGICEWPHAFTLADLSDKAITTIVNALNAKPNLDRWGILNA